MGANAQTTVQKFVDGAVLTAAQQNFSAATGVPVFATTVTRDAAFGGANKVLAQGQMCFIETGNVRQFYDGAVWITIGSGGLALIAAASFAAVAAVSLAPNTFSADYRKYLLLIDITANTVDSNPLNWRGRTSGVDNSNANYGYGLRGVRFSDGGLAGGGNSGGVTATAGQLAFMPSPITATAVQATIISPQLASPTSILSHAIGRGVSDAESVIDGGSLFSAATQFDALSFYPAAGTISGTYEIYGYAIA